MIERVAVLVTVAVGQATERKGQIMKERKPHYWKAKLSTEVDVFTLETQGVKMFFSH